jgi:hypothetical protein
MNRTRQILAVTLVATALAADRAVASAASAPVSAQSDASVMSMAGRIVNRLTSSLRRTVQAPRVWENRRVETVATPSIPPTTTPDPVRSRPQLNPFQFRLPPPAAV